jgi:hypothetical protein
MPIYRFTIDTPLDAGEISRRLQDLTRDEPGFWQSIKEAFGKRSEEEKPFIGTVDKSQFQLRRDIRYKNSFLPQIRGSITSALPGSKVIVRMRIHPFVAVFMCIWLFIAASSFVAGFSSKHIEIILIPACMCVFGIGLVCGGFYPEAIKARRLLEQAINVPASNATSGSSPYGRPPTRKTSYGTRTNLIVFFGMLLLVGSFFLYIHWFEVKEGVPQIEAAVRRQVSSLASTNDVLHSLELGRVTRTRMVDSGVAMTGYFQFDGSYSNQSWDIFVSWRKADSNAPIDKIEIGSTDKELRKIWSRK